MSVGTFFKAVGLLVKSWFTCVHFASDLTVIRLVEKVEDLPDDLFPCEVWKTRSLCKCGETIDYEFAFSVRYKNEHFNSDGTRIEDVQ